MLLQSTLDHNQASRREKLRIIPSSRIPSSQDDRSLNLYEEPGRVVLRRRPNTVRRSRTCKCMNSCGLCLYARLTYPSSVVLPPLRCHTGLTRTPLGVVDNSDCTVKSSSGATRFAITNIFPSLKLLQLLCPTPRQESMTLHKTLQHDFVNVFISLCC